jgi:MoxR-like ATPase
MAVYHKECRALAGHGAGPERVAKYHGKCAYEGCTINGGYVMRGETISCTRDNANGRRRGSGVARGEGESVYTQGAIQAETAPASVAPRSALSPIAGAILAEIQPHLPKSSVDLDQVIEIVRREMSVAPKPRATIVTVHEHPIEGPPAVKEMGRQHKQFPLLCQMLAAGVSVWITGPAGSGKTTAVHNAAIAMGADYSYTGSSGDAFAVTGYMGASGQYVPTAFRKAYESSARHVHLLDEVDGWDPNALLALNAALANGTASFPDGMVRRGACVLAAAANTIGHGATQEYCGRMRQDFAFLDRWTMLAWETDEDLERETCPHEGWVFRVQEIRRRVKEQGIKALITPRASYRGASLLAAGVDLATVEACELASRMTPDQWAKVSR